MDVVLRPSAPQPPLPSKRRLAAELALEGLLVLSEDPFLQGFDDECRSSAGREGSDSNSNDEDVEGASAYTVPCPWSLLFERLTFE